jgi:hypothetical protein
LFIRDPLILFEEQLQIAENHNNNKTHHLTSSNCKLPEPDNFENIQSVFSEASVELEVAKPIRGHTVVPALSPFLRLAASEEGEAAKAEKAKAEKAKAEKAKAEDRKSVV